MNYKICSKCKKELEIKNFRITKDNKVVCWCKQCENDYKKEWYKNNKKEIKSKRKIYLLNHKEQTAKTLKEYFIKNKESIVKYKHNYFQKNKSRINQKTLLRLKTDINFRISFCLRNRLRKVLKGTNKSKSTLKLLGCSVEELKNHLASKFTEGMSFKNYGKWHIDHIKPCAKFDLSKESEQRKCFNYLNLQPLWAKDNLSKGAK